MRKRFKNYKKIYLVLLILLFFVLAVDVQAYNPVYAKSSDDKDEFEEYIDNLLDCLDFSEVEELYNSLTNHIIKPSTFKNELKSFISGSKKLEFQEIVSLILDQLTGNIKELAPSLFIVLMIAIIEGLFSSIVINKSGVKDAIFLVCYASSVGLIFAETARITIDSLSFLANTSIAIQSAFPLFATISCLCGESSKIKILSPICALSTQIVGLAISKILIPAIIGICALSSVASLNEKSAIALTRNSIIDIFKWIIGIGVSILSVFTGVFSLGGSTRDSISLKTLKYTVGNTVPIIGGFAKESIEVVISAAQIIKSGVGAVFISVLLFIFIKQIVKLLCFSLMLSIANAICMPFAEKRYCDMILGFKKTTSLLLVIYVAITVLFFITCYAIFFVHV